MCDWSFIMYNAQDAVSSWVFPIFWLMVSVLGSKRQHPWVLVLS